MKLQEGFVALVSGVLFGLGLFVSGMVNPAKVIGFLDVAGHWIPDLAFVMAGALAVYGLAYFVFIKTGKTPVCVENADLPTKTTIDRKLISGAAIFGLGWGLVGICPGPALAGLATLDGSFVYFVAAFFAGSFMAKRFA